MELMSSELFCCRWCTSGLVGTSTTIALQIRKPQDEKGLHNTEPPKAAQLPCPVLHPMCLSCSNTSQEKLH